jgi:glycosyltransferase involved in cell wall biosynthesis
MKVVHVPFCFHPDPVGGTEVYVESLSRALRQRGVCALVAAPGPRSDHYEHDGLPVRRFGVQPSVRDIQELYGHGDAQAAGTFGRILDEERPNIVHLHAITRAVSLRLVREAAARGIGVVFTYHTPTVSCQRGTLMRWGREVCDGRLDRRACSACTLHGLGLTRAASRLLAHIPPVVNRALGRVGASGGVWTALRMSALTEQHQATVRALLEEVHQIVALCDWTRGVLLRNGVSAEKITLSRHGVARAGGAWQADQPEASSGPLRVAFLGRLDPTKGPDTLIRALRALTGRSMEADLYGVARLDDVDRYLVELRRLAAGDPRIRLLPALPHEEMLQRLPSYHVVVVPSRWLETGPLVVLEAFAAGVPVIGSRLGGIAELIRDGVDGMLVEAESVAGWTEAIRRLDEDRAMLERLRRGVRPPRTMDDVADDMMTVYRRLPGRRAAPQDMEPCRQER